MGKLLGALVFGFALVFIYYTKSELLTSNMMIVSIGAYHHGTSWRRALRLLGLCYLGNFLGGLVIAVLVYFSSLLDGNALKLVNAAVAHKLEYVASGPTGWGDLFVRAILCNFLINLAMLLVYNGLIHDDLTKCLAMIMSVFIFAFVGLEHSVANTVLFTIVGLKEGLDVGAAAANVLIALIGNYIGGGVLIGFYYAYVNDDSRQAATSGGPPGVIRTPAHRPRPGRGAEPGADHLGQRRDRGLQRLGGVDPDAEGGLDRRGVGDPEQRDGAHLQVQVDGGDVADEVCRQIPCL